MPTLVLVLRVLSVLAFAGPMLVVMARRRGAARTGSRSSGGARAPLAANLAAFGAFLASLVAFSASPAALTAPLLAAAGSLLACAGGALVVRSRTELGPAWSLVPRADEGSGLVTTGPYRLVRHPIYLGLALLTTGEAVAFGSWPALASVFIAIVPTLAWRARAEEKVLLGTFGERYADYRRRTRMIVPYVF